MGPEYRGLNQMVAVYADSVPKFRAVLAVLSATGPRFKLRLVEKSRATLRPETPLPGMPWKLAAVPFVPSVFRATLAPPVLVSLWAVVPPPVSLNGILNRRVWACETQTDVASARAANRTILDVFILFGYWDEGSVLTGFETRYHEFGMLHSRQNCRCRIKVQLLLGHRRALTCVAVNGVS